MRCEMTGEGGVVWCLVVEDGLECRVRQQNDENELSTCMLTFLNASSMATHRALLPQTVKELICRPNARTAGWTSLLTPSMVFRLGADV